MKKIIYLCILFILFTLVGCSLFVKWQIKYPDNFVEEEVEQFIEDQTDYSVDLTPFTGKEAQRLNPKVNPKG